MSNINANSVKIYKPAVGLGYRPGALELKGAQIKIASAIVLAKKKAHELSSLDGL